MWPDRVVDLSELLVALPCLLDRSPPVGVNPLVAHLAVEAPGERVLGRLARLDELDRDAVLVGPGVEHATAELGTVVADDALLVAPLECDRVQQVDHAA